MKKIYIVILILGLCPLAHAENNLNQTYTHNTTRKHTSTPHFKKLSSSSPHFTLGADIATIKAKLPHKHTTFITDDITITSPNKFKSGSLNAGIKFNKFITLETFYQQSATKKEHTQNLIANITEFNNKESIKYSAYGADIIGFITLYQHLDLLASLGLGQYKFKTKKDIDLYNTIVNVGYHKSSHTNFDSLGIRFGLGFQYNITEHFALRSLLRYITLTNDDYIKHLTEITFGARYTF